MWQPLFKKDLGKGTLESWAWLSEVRRFVEVLPKNTTKKLSGQWEKKKNIIRL